MEINMILDWNEYRDKAVEAVSEGIVLLSNRNGALPLDPGKKTAVFGRIQLDYYKSGTGSGGMVNVSHVINIPEGLKLRGAVIDQELLDIYTGWTGEHPFDRGASWGGEPWCQEEMPLTDEIVSSAAKRCETALIIIGRTAGEEMDNSCSEGSFFLNQQEKQVLKLTRKYFKKTVVLLNVASVIDMGFVDEFDPDAVLYVWHGGMMGGLGTADVLLGSVSPSGRLTDTIAYSIEDYPSNPYFGDGDRDFYSEDIYVGYRYFETFARDRVRYPFGYGISYTEFGYDDIKAEYCGNEGLLSGMDFSIKVTNKGGMPGKDVVQIYCEAPQGSLGKPSRVLCGFKKTGIIGPQHSETVRITVVPESFLSYDDSGETGYKDAYILEKGTYVFYAGKNVEDSIPVFSAELPETKVFLRTTGAMAPVIPFKRMVNRNGQAEMIDAPVALLEEYTGKEGIPDGIYRAGEALRRIDNMPEEIPFTGDIGIKLSDVAEGRHDLNEFIGQLSDRDLSCIIRGEGMGSPKVTAGTAAAFGGVSGSLSSFGVPCACLSDGPSGMRMDCGTRAFSLPGGTMLACTWNPQLMEELFGFTGLEMKANHVEGLLGPGMNIHRHPLNGRNFEYFSEDPFLTGKIASAQLKGLHSAGVTGTIKHFCGNNREKNRHFLDSVISARALREIYLKGFEMAVREGNAYTVMTTYGSVNGLWTAASYDLTTTILRNEWGFDGLVMTDWWANINRRGQKPDKRDFAAMAMAQNDVYMVCSDGENHDDNTLESLEKGELKRSELQRNAANILRVILRSNAMKRLMGQEEAVEITNRDEEGVISQEDVPCYHISDSLTVDLKNVKAVRDTSYSFILDMEKAGMYDFSITASSDAGELAQIPVTVFFMGTACGTFTWNGTGGKPVTFRGKTYLFSRYTTVRLYFAQGGPDLIEMEFKINSEV